MNGILISGEPAVPELLKEQVEFGICWYMFPFSQ